MAMSRFLNEVEDSINGFLDDILEYASQMEAEEDEDARSDLRSKIENSCNYMKEYFGI